MGEVYRAHDAKLKRDVALKVLPEAFANDAQRMARFEREAQLLASLNHPNIAAIYGLEQSDNLRFLVLELVPGETLAERLRRGPLPVSEALELARQIADAVAAAHDNGVIHRDLKPANIKITPDGQIKVLDFGLAPVRGGRSRRDWRRRLGLPNLERARDKGRRHSWNGGLHEPGASAGKDRRQAHRHLLLRRRPLRDAHGTTALQGRGCRRHDGIGHEERSRLSGASFRAPPAGARASLPLPREGPEEAPS